MPLFQTSSLLFCKKFVIVTKESSRRKGYCIPHMAEVECSIFLYGSGSKKYGPIPLRLFPLRREWKWRQSAQFEPRRRRKFRQVEWPLLQCGEGLLHLLHQLPFRRKGMGRRLIHPTVRRWRRPFFYRWQLPHLLPAAGTGQALVVSGEQIGFFHHGKKTGLLQQVAPAQGFGLLLAVGAAMGIL